MDPFGACGEWMLMWCWVKERVLILLISIPLNKNLGRAAHVSQNAGKDESVPDFINQIENDSIVVDLLLSGTVSEIYESKVGEAVAHSVA